MKLQLVECYSESNFRLFSAIIVEAGESSRVRGSVTWLAALWTIM
jgi:hypothetical protein